MDWTRERDALLDMCVTASRSHLVAAQALWNAMATDGDTQPTPGDQKILATKLAAEEMSALEDLGALVWAVGHRAEHGGVIRAYLAYPPRSAQAVYEAIVGATPVRELLELPSDDVLRLRLNEKDFEASITTSLLAYICSCEVAHNRSSCGKVKLLNTGRPLSTFRRPSLCVCERERGREEGD